jgi:hypothetical protein
MPNFLVDPRHERRDEGRDDAIRHAIAAAVHLGAVCVAEPRDPRLAEQLGERVINFAFEKSKYSGLGPVAKPYRFTYALLCLNSHFAKLSGTFSS